MAAALSAKGYQLSRDIMRLNITEGELMNRLARFNEWLYYFTVIVVHLLAQWDWTVASTRRFLRSLTGRLRFT
jgi:hypothetical protein